jgi:heme-degrading monooxygenase HmoA
LDADQNDEDGPVILEHALLDVVPGREADYEAAFAKAKPIISSMKGFVSLRLERCIETPNRFLLLVEWETLEDHTVGFRSSAEYQDWRALLHDFYDPFPTVEHYEQVTGVSSRAS